MVIVLFVIAMHATVLCPIIQVIKGIHCLFCVGKSNEWVCVCVCAGHLDS